MKYQPPYGTSDPNGPYIDGDPSISQEGSIVPAHSIEYPQREIVNAILKGCSESTPQFTPTDGDLFQLLRAIRDGHLTYGVDTGSANNISVQLDPPLTAYRAGFTIRVRVAATCTGATQININGLGNVQVRRTNGAALVAGDVQTGGIATLTNDGTNFQLVNFLGAIGGTTNNFFIDIPFAQDTGPVNAMVVDYTPNAAPPTNGDLILVRVGNINTAAVTIAIDGTAAKSIKRNDAQALGARDLELNETILLEYQSNGDYWQMMRLCKSQVLFKLNQDTTFYVRTDAGTDVGKDGSANTAASAFLTVQGAINFISQNYMLGGRLATIQLGMAGTYLGAVSFSIPLGGNILLKGTDRNTYIIQHTPTALVSNVLTVMGVSVDIDGITFYNNAAGYNTCAIGNGGHVDFSNVRFSGVPGGVGSDVVIDTGGSITFSGFIDFWRNCWDCIAARAGDVLVGDWTTLITVNGITMGDAFVTAVSGSSVSWSHTFCGIAGTANGRRYLVLTNSVIDTEGGPTTYFPGSVAGLTDASSVYA